MVRNKTNQTKFLKPLNETIQIKGKLFYHDSSRAWNIIRLKKEIVNKFPYLTNKMESFSYLMKLPNSFDSLKEEIKVLEKTNIIPIILLLEKN